MITPMIREIRKKFPDCYLATLTNPNSANVLLNNPYLDALIVDDLQKKSFWKVVKLLRKQHFTDGLLVLPTERGAYQMWMAGIKTRIGVGHKLYEVISGMRNVDRHDYIPLKHESDFCMDLVRKSGIETDNLEPEIYVTGEEKTEGMEFLNKLGIEDNDFKFILHTGSLGSSPNWSEGKYLILIKEILKLKVPNLKIILTAIEMSNEFLNNIAELKEPGIIDVSRKLQGLRHLI